MLTIPSNELQQIQLDSLKTPSSAKKNNIMEIQWDY